MRILAIAATRNRLFRKDGDEFARQARKFKEVHEARGNTVELIETKEKKSWRKYKVVLDALTAPDREPIDALVLFCHGWHNGIGLGFTRYHIPELAEAIVHASGGSACDVVMYACSVFKRANSFGPKLCMELFEQSGTGGLIVGHRTSGHTTRNPHVWMGNSLEHPEQELDYPGQNLNRMPWHDFIALPWLKRRKSTEWKNWVAELKTDEQYFFWC